jgi:hypothetical protein
MSVGFGTIAATTSSGFTATLSSGIGLRRRKPIAKQPPTRAHRLADTVSGKVSSDSLDAFSAGIRAKHSFAISVIPALKALDRVIVPRGRDGIDNKLLFAIAIGLH